MTVIHTPAPSRVRANGSTAYWAYSPRQGMLGIVGNAHFDRPGDAITQRTLWWAERRDSPAGDAIISAENLNSRATATAWLSARAATPTHVEPTADQRFTAHLAAIASERGHDEAWKRAADAAFMRLHELLASRYSESSPRALWREVITILAWFEATEINRAE